MSSSSILRVPIDSIVQDQRKMIVVDSKDSLPKALATLAKNGIYAAPVYDKQKGEYLGFIDVVDMVAVVVQIFSETELLGQDFEAFTMDDKEKRFDSYKSGTVVDLCKRNPWKPVDEKADLAAAITIFQQEGLHRVPVLKHKSSTNVTHVLTETTIISYLEKNLLKMGAVTSKTVKELKLGYKTVISVTEKDNALKAFEHMAKSRVSAVAVVDSADGSIVASVSAKEVRVVLDVKASFDVFTKPVLEFVAVAKDKKKTAFPFLTCTQSSTLGEVITRLAALRIHRLFLVDDNKVPIGVVSLGDVLQVVVQACK